MYLLVGSLSANRAEKDVSGTVVSLKLLLSQLRSDGIELEFVDTGDIRRSRFATLGYFNVISQILRKAKKASVLSLHLSPHGFLYLAPVVVGIQQLYRKPVILRLFGGMSLSEMKGVRGKLAIFFARKMDGVLLQSKALVEEGKALGFQNIDWYPTSRIVPGPSEPNPWYGAEGDYVFIAQIKIKKGILELIEAAKKLPELPFSVYGPFYDDLDESIFEQIPNLTYKGVLSPDSVPTALQKSKALVFPTYLDEEGYSGIIIEAFGAGCPIICTSWKFLPEIVDDSCAVLCEPKNVDSLVKAITCFNNNPDSWLPMSKASYDRRLNFSIETMSNKLLHCLEKI